MAESAWKLGETEDLIDKVNEQINQIDLNDSGDDSCSSKGARVKTKRRDTKRLVQSATTSPSSNPSTPSHSSTPGLFRQNSADNSFSQSKKFSGTRSKIPLRQRLSASDSLCETTRRYNYLHSRSIGKSSSSSSSQSQSSEATVTKTKRVKDRFRRSSDSLPEKGYLVPYGLRIQHAAHRCAWSESDNSTSLGSVTTSQTPTMSKRVKSTHGSYSTLSPTTSRDNSCRQHRASNGRPFSQQQSKFDVYLPLCEVQQGLKKGEVLEGVLRINPRNYEDAYISAPEGAMDIYLSGLRDRNRALNGDVVAVRLGPVEEWKIMWENIKEYEERKGHSIFDEPPVASFNYPIEEEEVVVEQEEAVGASAAAAACNDEYEELDSDLDLGENEMLECSGWDQNYGPRMPDTVEILGVADLRQQIDDFCKEVKMKRKNNKARQRRKKKDDGEGEENSNSTNPSEPRATTSTSSNNGGQDQPPDSSNIASTKKSSPIVHASLDVENISPSSSSLLDSVVKDNLIASTNKLADLNLNSNDDNNDDKSSASNQNVELKSNDAPVVIDTWTMDNDDGPRWIVTPEDLLRLDDFEIPRFGSTDDNGRNNDSDDVDSADESSKAVAPDELSEEEYSPSVGGDSNSSQYAEEAAEEAAFFATQQDVYNNNSGEDNVVDAYLVLDQLPQQPQPQQEAEPESNNPPDEVSTIQPSDPVSISLALEEAVNYSSSSDNDNEPVTGLEQKLADVHKVTNTVNMSMSTWKPSPTEVPDESEGCASNKCQLDLPESSGAENVNGDSNPSTNQLPSSGADQAEQGNIKGKKKRNRKRKKKNKQDFGGENKPPLDVNNQRDKPAPIKFDDHNTNSQQGSQPPKAVKSVNNQTPNFQSRQQQQSVVKSQNGLQHHNFTIYDILSLPTSGKFVQKTGKVVYIIEKVHSRVAMGRIKLLQDRNPNWALFSPADYRLPRIMVPLEDCPKGFFERPGDYATTLFIARITEWAEDSMFAKGRLARSLGEAGEIEPETEGILMEHDVDFREFQPNVLKDLPQNLPFIIPECEIKTRRDFRDECVFTIDPKTARDLDDAISCKVVSENVFEVGVHIADVSYFVKEDTNLDEEASKRATSVYLVQKVVPMLPRLLCEELCSLNPGTDRLTFSVVWKMTSEGKILDEWFGKTVIRSCVKLSYEHAQDMIENPNKEFQTNELPEITGGYSIKEINDRVQNLQKIAANLRRKRFQDGALRLDQVKLQFVLDQETGLPSGYSIHDLKDSNRMIEELMLLANMAVARKIYHSFPQKAFLRSHEPPQTKMMDDVVALCESMGIFLDSSSAGALQESLSRYMGDDIMSEGRVSVLTQLLSKPMKPATYFCAGWVSDPYKFRHYALNVPLYTHFTSPIRRYPDIIVHRLLAAALKIGKVTSKSDQDLQRCATHCNQKKLNARRVHEMSCELFLAAFVKACGPLHEKAMVMTVMDHSFDVLIIKMGVVKRIYCDKLDIFNAQFEKQMGVPRLILQWKRGKSGGYTQVLSLFSMVDVVLTSFPKDPMKFQAIMKPPQISSL